MTQAHDRTRVVKKISTTQPGAIKLARIYGDALVCVRYRHDVESHTRYTTVELVVDQATIGKNRREVDTVNVQVAPNDLELLIRIRSNGGQWDSQVGLWRLPRHKAEEMGLLCWVVEA